MKRLPVPPINEVETYHRVRRTPHGYLVSVAVRQLRPDLSRRETMEMAFIHLADELEAQGADPYGVLTDAGFDEREGEEWR